MKQKSIKKAILGSFLFSGLLIAQKSVNGTITDQDGVPLRATIVVLRLTMERQQTLMEIILSQLQRVLL